MNEAEKIYREVEERRRAFLYRQKVNSKNKVITFRREEDAGEILRRVKEKRLLRSIRYGKKYYKGTITALANVKLMGIRRNNSNNQDNREGQEDER